MFNILRDQLMGVTEAQDSGPGNPQKDYEDQVSWYGLKAASNTVPDHK